jgi:hypothetical protein
MHPLPQPVPPRSVHSEKQFRKIVVGLKLSTGLHPQERHYNLSTRRQNYILGSVKSRWYKRSPAQQEKIARTFRTRNAPLVE